MIDNGAVQDQAWQDRQQDEADREHWARYSAYRDACLSGQREEWVDFDDNRNHEVLLSLMRTMHDPWMSHAEKVGRALGLLDSLVIGAAAYHAEKM